MQDMNATPDSLAQVKEEIASIVGSWSAAPFNRFDKQAVLDGVERMKPMRRWSGHFKVSLNLGTVFPKIHYHRLMQDQVELVRATSRLIEIGVASFVMCGVSATNRLIHTRHPREKLNHFCGLPRHTAKHMHPDGVAVFDKDGALLINMNI